jgi:hypothetical protein
VAIRLIGKTSLGEAALDRDCPAELPPCEFNLRTAKGKAAYQRLAKQLTDAGRLTSDMHLRLSRYALAADTVHDHQEQGLPIRASMVDQLRRAEKDMDLEDEVRSSTPPEPERSNPFARCGFAARARAPKT